MASSTSLSNDIFGTAHTGPCRTDPLSNSGKRIQLAKMLILVILPLLGLWGYSVTLVAEVVKNKTDAETLYESLQFSLNLGKLVHRLQRERDMSVLYLSAIGPETKTFLLHEYMNTDNALDDLSYWPVDLDRNKRKEFQTKQRMIMYLAKHRQELNADTDTIDDEIGFYTKIIDVFILWIYDSIKESKFSQVWRIFVAFQKITTSKEDLGIERALGTMYFANGGFPNNSWYETYNRQVNAFRTMYSSARQYSQFVDYISVYDSVSTNNNLSDTIYEFRYEIQHAAEGQIMGRKSIAKAQWWFNNCTALLDLLLDLQLTLGNSSLDKIISLQTIAKNSMIAYITILVVVISLFPAIVYMTENLTSSIQRYALLLVDKTKELNNEKKRTDSLLYQMVPKQVAEKLKTHKSVDAEFFQSVTILFSDICGFSTLTMSLEPMSIVKLLNALYESIDELLNERDLYKVETINDSYMVVSGLPERNGNQHSAIMGEFALVLLEMMKEYRFGHIQTPIVALKIGLNTGPCMAGIVGSAMLRYCLFGDTVNTASRMKSHSLANMIHISPSTCLALKAHGSFMMKKRGSVNIKMVPKQVAEKLKTHKSVDAEFFQSVTILFSDICGFSTLTMSLEPMSIVKLLNALYESIDELLNERDLYKVETINDSYMVVSGLPERNGNQHSAIMGEFALVLLEMMKEYRFGHIQTPIVALKIGLNTGPCMAGIVGSAMLRYCLFGDTVNTASRMKSHSLANMIHISPSTCLALKAHGSFMMKKRGSVNIKGKGEMLTYWLTGRKRVSDLSSFDDIPLPSEEAMADAETTSMPLSYKVMEEHREMPSEKQGLQDPYEGTDTYA